jgi:hypothetical protein
MTDTLAQIKQKAADIIALTGTPAPAPQTTPAPAVDTRPVLTQTRIAPGSIFQYTRQGIDSFDTLMSPYVWDWLKNNDGQLWPSFNVAPGAADLDAITEDTHRTQRRRSPSS